MWQDLINNRSQCVMWTNDQSEKLKLRVCQKTPRKSGWGLEQQTHTVFLYKRLIYQHTQQEHGKPAAASAVFHQVLHVKTDNFFFMFVSKRLSARNEKAALVPASIITAEVPLHNTPNPQLHTLLSASRCECVCGGGEP